VDAEWQGRKGQGVGEAKARLNHSSSGRWNPEAEILASFAPLHGYIRSCSQAEKNLQERDKPQNTNYAEG
jgi:hypothetical protein